MSELEHPKSLSHLAAGQRLQQHTTYIFTPSHAEFHILDHGAKIFLDGKSEVNLHVGTILGISWGLP